MGLPHLKDWGHASAAHSRMRDIEGTGRPAIAMAPESSHSKRTPVNRLLVFSFLFLGISFAALGAYALVNPDLLTTKKPSVKKKLWQCGETAFYDYPKHAGCTLLSVTVD